MTTLVEVEKRKMKVPTSVTPVLNRRKRMFLAPIAGGVEGVTGVFWAVDDES